MKAKLILAAIVMLALSVGSANANPMSAESTTTAMHATNHATGKQPKKHRHHKKHHRHHKMMKH